MSSSRGKLRSGPRPLIWLILLSIAFQARTAIIIGSPPEALAADPSLTSWNTAVSCSPTLTTIGEIVGNQSNAQGGASYDGGGFKPGIPDKRSTSPPCSVNGTPAFVEVRSVRIIPASLAHEDYALYPNGNFSDTTATLEDPNCFSRNIYLCRIFIEIDRAWKSAGIAPEDPLFTALIDIQGFVYWNSLSSGQAWHSYSGWELHPVTASHASNASDNSPAANIPVLVRMWLYGMVTMGLVCTFLGITILRLQSKLRSLTGFRRLQEQL